MLNIDITESLSYEIKIYQSNEIYLLKDYLNPSYKKYLDILNYWLVNDIYINYLLDQNQKDFIKKIFKLFKEKLPINNSTLFYCCKRNNIKMVKKLIKVFGSNLPIDYDAFYIACDKNFNEIVVLLIQNYGNKIPIDEQIISIICRNNYTYLKNCLKCLIIIYQLMIGISVLLILHVITIA